MSLPEIKDILFTADGITNKPMCRELLANDLTADNIDEAEFTDAVDPIDTLRRIGTAWHAIGLTCECKSNQACNICEVYYLLEEAFKLPEGAE
jgi:hypothetical protein